jgi:hypothetical protein
MAFFSKSNVMIKFLHNLAFLSQKRLFFGENVFKIITSVPVGVEVVGLNVVEATEEKGVAPGAGHLKVA